MEEETKEGREGEGDEERVSKWSREGGRCIYIVFCAFASKGVTPDLVYVKTKVCV